MGAALIEQGAPEVAETFAIASEAFGFDVADVCLNASAETLRDTAFAQPAMCTLSVAVAKALEARGVRPAYVAGFSLGQIAALAVSGMVSERDAFRIAAFRAKVMAEAAAVRPGSMCALLGGEPEEASEVCSSAAQGDVLVCANYNAPGQIVISGDVAAVDRAAALWKERPRHKASMLATSGAFHSPLMQSAAEALVEFLEEVEFHEARTPLVCNVDARPLSVADARTWRAKLFRPFCSSKACIGFLNRVSTRSWNAGSAACSPSSSSALSLPRRDSRPYPPKKLPRWQAKSLAAVPNKKESS